MKSVEDFNLIKESARCLRCSRPGCVSSCPVGNDIPSFLQLARQGDARGAVQLIGHPVGEICGYVCPHESQCQGGCVLARRGRPVLTGEVERRLFADNPYLVTVRGDAAANTSVAVVGGGVSGLTFAVKMYEQGADVTVFEKDELLSTLRLIPEFRLPRAAIDRVVDCVEDKFRFVRRRVDSELLRRIADDYDVVYLASGASRCYGLNIQGEDFATPYSDFLNKNGAFLNGDGDLRGKKVIVIGGGNTAMDCARSARRLGARTAVAYRRRREDMPAFDKEVSAAVSEGAEFVYNVAPVSVSRVGHGLELTLAETECEGRGKLTVTERVRTEQCDVIVTALGSTFDDSIVEGLDDLTGSEKFFIGGDADGGKTVARAVADAMRVARIVSEKTCGK